jgi:hypothetical protein
MRVPPVKQNVGLASSFYSQEAHVTELDISAYTLTSKTHPARNRGG